MDQDFDLLGDPIPAGWGKRGRPAHIPTEENRSKVMLLQALDWTPDRIAAGIGVSAKTLRKHYSRELRQREAARARADAARLWMLWRQVAAGNVAAEKELNKRFERHDLANTARAYEEPEARRPARLSYMGKKEAAQIAAASAGVDSEWGEDLLGGAGARPN